MTTSLSHLGGAPRIRPAVCIRLASMSVVSLLFSLLVILAALPLLAGFGITLGSVDGSSMTPYLNPGDAILVRRADPRTVVVGDVVSYRRDGRLILHRIVDRGFQPDGTIVFYAKGDANQEGDLPIHGSDIRGRFVFAAPMLGGPVEAFTGALNRLQQPVLFGGPMLLLAFLSVVARRTGLKPAQ